MKNIKKTLFSTLLYLALCIVIVFLSFDVIMLYLHFSGQDDVIKQIVSTIDQTFDKIR